MLQEKTRRVVVLAVLADRVDLAIAIGTETIDPIDSSNASFRMI